MSKRARSASYRIRKGDSWPNDEKQRHGTDARTMANSEVRPYSWPCLLVFVTEWEDPDRFAQRPADRVPSTLYMPDGRRVPVCVVEAPREARTETVARTAALPVNNLGPGHPVVARVQGHDYLATIGCLVSDGHKVYALTNRHVTGDADEAIYLRASGKPVGTSAAGRLTRLPFSTLYPSFPGHDTFVNLDIGLVDITRLDRWTAKVRGIGAVGPMADFSDAAISLSLVGCHVRGVGAAGGDMRGEVQALFYRYKESRRLRIRLRRRDRSKGDGLGGSDRVLHASRRLWHHVDAGAVPARIVRGARKRAVPAPCDPVGPKHAELRRQGLAAGAMPSRRFFREPAALLEVDLVRDWNVDQPDTWGAIGHFSIAARSSAALSGRFPKLVELMRKNETDRKPERR